MCYGMKVRNEKWWRKKYMIHVLRRRHSFCPSTGQRNCCLHQRFRIPLICENQLIKIQIKTKPQTYTCVKCSKIPCLLATELPFQPPYCWLHPVARMRKHVLCAQSGLWNPDLKSCRALPPTAGFPNRLFFCLVLNRWDGGRKVMFTVESNQAKRITHSLLPWPSQKCW